VFSVSLKGDYAIEANETVLLQLSSATNASLGASGTGTILNDDGLPGVLHHYRHRAHCLAAILGARDDCGLRKPRTPSTSA
jgi:hypothetical protein